MERNSSEEPWIRNWLWYIVSQLCNYAASTNLCFVLCGFVAYLFRNWRKQPSLCNPMLWVSCKFLNITLCWFRLDRGVIACILINHIRLTGFTNGSLLPFFLFCQGPRCLVNGHFSVSQGRFIAQLVSFSYSSVFQWPDFLSSLNKTVKHVAILVQLLITSCFLSYSDNFWVD